MIGTAGRCVLGANNIRQNFRHGGRPIIMILFNIMIGIAGRCVLGV